MSQLNIMSWNIEGLSLLKETGIIDYMFRFDVDVCCLQETRGSKSDVFDCNGYEFILSGSSDGPTDWYGVGFVIFPRLRRHRRGFCQINDRIASLKLKCGGGAIAIITVLAPHNLRPQQEK